MKQAKTLHEIAEELERQLHSKRDFIVPTRSLRMNCSEFVRLSLQVNGKLEEFGLRPIAHEQLGSHYGIPKKYYDTMLDSHPTLLQSNLNYWFENQPQKRMIRVLDNGVRAFLSNRYRRLDHYDIANVVIPIIRDAGCQFETGEITESHLYLKALAPKIEEVEVGDAVQAGLIISNSEVGKGSLRIEPLIYRLQCKNGMIVQDASIRQTHVGKELEEGYVRYAEDTLKAEDELLWRKVRDTVQSIVSPEFFRRIVERLKEAKKTKLSDVEKAVEITTTRYGINENEKKDVIRHILESSDPTAYGMANAVTRTAQDVETYDRSIELERIGWQIMTQANFN